MAIVINTKRDALRFALIRATAGVVVISMLNAFLTVLAFGTDLHSSVTTGTAILCVISTGAIGVALGGGNASYRFALTLLELSRANAELLGVSRRDPLTGLLNRRGFEEVAKSFIVRGTRNQTRFAMFMCDIDRFKVINDKFGHEFGDKVLVETSKTMSAFAEQNGILIARHGGEEFIGILNASSTFHAKECAEAFRKACANEIAAELSSARVSVSIGCTFFASGMDIPAAVRAADKALYVAKGLGRNCVAWTDIEQTRVPSKRKTKGSHTTEEITAEFA